MVCRHQAVQGGDTVRRLQVHVVVVDVVAIGGVVSHVWMKLLLRVRVGVVLAMRVLVRVGGHVARHIEVVVLVMVRLLVGWMRVRRRLVTPI